MKVAIIGMGNMGSKYAVMIAEGKISGMELIAVTRIRPERFNSIKNILPNDLFIYESAEKLFAAYDANEFFIDAVLIVTPHYSHEEIAINAFQRGLHVLCDKPAGVYSRQARNMLAAYKLQSGRVRVKRMADGVETECNIDLLSDYFEGA